MAGMSFAFTSQALEHLRTERLRQVEKGYDAAHDDTHTGGELLDAADYYSIRARDGQTVADETECWPWAGTTPPPAGEADTELGDLVKAAALFLAEIERRLRAGERISA